MPQPNKIQGYEIPSQALENWRYSGMTDPAVVGTDESAGPSQPSERDSPVEVQKYPVYWPYWTEKSVPIPAPDKSGGQDQASPPSPPIPPATEQIPGTASPGPANQFVTERQDHKGEEDPAKPDSDWLRRELEMLFQLRAKGRSFEEISQDLSKSEHGNSARRDAKACEGKWTHFTYETNRNKIKWTAEEDSELVSFVREKMPWSEIAEKFCYRGRLAAKTRYNNQLKPQVVLENGMRKLESRER